MQIQHLFAKGAWLRRLSWHRAGSLPKSGCSKKVVRSCLSLSLRVPWPPDVHCTCCSQAETGPAWP